MTFSVNKTTFLQIEHRRNSGPDTPRSVLPEMLERKLADRYRMWYVGTDGDTLHSVRTVRGYAHLTRPGYTPTTAPGRLVQRGSSIMVYTYASLLLKLYSFYITPSHNYLS